MTRSGYTLAELMIALLLAAIAVGIVTTGVQQSLAFERRIDLARQDREAVTATLAALRSRLEAIVPATLPTTETAGTGDGGRTRAVLFQQSEAAAPTQDAQAASPSADRDERPVLFAGTATDLVFLAADPGYPARPGLYEYRLSVTTDGDNETDAAHTLSLSRRALPELSAFGNGGEAQSWTLLTIGEPVRLSYAADSGNWRASWQDEDVLPAQVRIEFGEADDQPPFIVTLPAMPPEDETGDEMTEEAQ